MAEVFWTKWDNSDFELVQLSTKGSLPQVWDNGQYNFADPSLNKEAFIYQSNQFIERLHKGHLFSRGLEPVLCFKKDIKSSLRYMKKRVLFGGEIVTSVNLQRL